MYITCYLDVSRQTRIVGVGVCALLYDGLRRVAPALCIHGDVLQLRHTQLQ